MNAPSIDEVLAHVDALPEGVQAEVRRALRACLDVVGVATVRMLEIAAERDALDPMMQDRAVRELLVLCGIEAAAETPVTLSPRPGCELCGQPMGTEHAHAADVNDRRLLCVCRPCAITLHGEGRYRSLDAAVETLADTDDAPAWWDEIGIPVELAFFIGSADGHVTAFYPGHAGVVESTLEIDSLPVSVADDVEALLVLHRERFEAWRVPVDRCYELAGLLRHGTAGVPPAEITAGFFDRLRS